MNRDISLIIFNIMSIQNIINVVYEDFEILAIVLKNCVWFEFIFYLLIIFAMAHRFG